MKIVLRDKSDIAYKTAVHNLTSMMRVEEVIVLCIGTDRSTGDCLGPLVGTKLKENDCRLTIYGTLQNPVHAKNLEDNIEMIQKKHPNAKIIAIDACIGSIDSVQDIQIKDTPLTPGAAMDKGLPAIGDISIVGIVNISEGAFEFMTLQNTRLNVTYNLAEIICDMILDSSIESCKIKEIS